MVEKRTLAFVTLAILIWALTATSLMAYYYTRNLTLQEEVQQRQKLLDELARNSQDSLTRWNLLAGDYGLLFGDYQWFQGENYAPLMSKYEKLMVNLRGNYTNLLNISLDLNETYTRLWQRYQALNQTTVLAEKEFGELLSETYKLLTSMTLKEMGESIGEATIMQVSLLIDYGNTTERWYNISVPLGTTLFNLTQTVVEIEYDYYATAEPGHIFINSINNSAEGWWIWYYWDENRREWVSGPVGCDAWMLKDGGIYKWHQSQ